MRRVQNTLQSGAQSIMCDLVEGDLQRLNFEVVIESARQGDPVAIAALQEVGRNLGIGVANLVNIFNPELVVLGGALNLASPYLLPVMEQTVAENSLQPAFENLRIAASAHGTDTCVMGAIALVLDDILREPMFS
jgi:predicted NBD/HSP70 family sugar kinase